MGGSLDSWRASDGNFYPASSTTPEAQAFILQSLVGSLQVTARKGQRLTFDMLGAHLNAGEVPLAVLPGTTEPKRTLDGGALLTNHRLIIAERSRSEANAVPVRDIVGAKPVSGFLRGVTIDLPDGGITVRGAGKHDCIRFAELTLQVVNETRSGLLKPPIEAAEQASVGPTLRGTGWPHVELVGTSHRVAAIGGIVGYTAGEHITTATLEREPQNPHDPHAVRALVVGQHVGYIAREDAPRYRRLLDAMRAAGVPAIARARLWYDPAYSDGRPAASIRLDLGEPAFAWPINTAEVTGQARIWPEGRPLKVTPGDGDAGLAALLAGRYDEIGCAAYVDLPSPAEGQTKVAVTFAGETVGSLTPQSSKKMAPALAEAARNGRRLLALCEVKGNSLAADVKLRIEPPQNMTEQQIRDLTG